MRRILLTLVLAALPAVLAWPQQDPAGDDAADAKPAAEADSDREEEIDVTELEEESYADAEEEDFVPTEDIPTDQAIPFPTDI